MGKGLGLGLGQSKVVGAYKIFRREYCSLT